MSINLPSHYVQQYATNLQLLLQQLNSRLKDKVATGEHYGEQAAAVDQVGKIEMQEPAGRFAPIGRVDAVVDRRWVAPASYDLPQLIDTFDKLKLLLDPNSTFVQNGVAACNRRYDQTIIAAFFAAAQTGKTGTTSTSFLSANQVAVTMGAAAACGLNFKKIREAKRILMSYDIDFAQEQVFIGLTSKQHDDLLAEQQVISLDYNEKPVLADGKIVKILGMEVVQSELFSLDTSSYRRVPVWCKSGMHLGQWGAMETNISKREDLSGQPWQAYQKLTIGATRLDEKKVIEIKCSEA